MAIDSGAAGAGDSTIRVAVLGLPRVALGFFVGGGDYITLAVRPKHVRRHSRMEARPGLSS
jgi:hypothetical protein